MALTNLKAYIMQSGLTQNAVADKLEMNRGQFSLIVNGRLVPSYNQRRKIERLLGVPVDRLLEDYQVPDKEPERLRRRK